MLVMGGERPSLITILTLSAIFVILGVFTVEYSIAAQELPPMSSSSLSH